MADDPNKSRTTAIFLRQFAADVTDAFDRVEEVAKFPARSPLGLAPGDAARVDAFLKTASEALFEVRVLVNDLLVEWP